MLCFCFIIYFPSCAILYFQWGYVIQLNSVTINFFIFQFNEEARSPFVKKFKTIIHPGEVWAVHSLIAHIHSSTCTKIKRNIYFWSYLLLNLIWKHATVIFVQTCKVDILRSYVCNYSYEKAICVESLSNFIRFWLYCHRWWKCLHIIESLGAHCSNYWVPFCRWTESGNYHRTLR